MKNNNHRFRMPGTSDPRYRFHLPDDLREVKLIAFQQGVISATEQKKQGLELTPEAIEAGSISAALLLEKETHAGRVGANDPVLFRKTFADMHAQIWQAVYAYWNEAPEVFSSFMRRPVPQQQSNARQIAELYLDQVEQKIAAGESIQFAW